MKYLTKALAVFLLHILFTYVVWGIWGVNENDSIKLISISVIWIFLSMLYGYFGYKALVVEKTKIGGTLFILVSIVSILSLGIALKMTFGNY